MISLEMLNAVAARWAGRMAAALLVALAVLMIPTVHASESGENADASAAVEAASQVSANPAPALDLATPQERTNMPNLTWQKFPAEFADYYTTQRLTGSPTEPRSFCRSSKPLLVDGSNSSLGVRAILDESGGTGTGYDTLYVDTNGDGDFASPAAYKVSPAERKTGLEGRPLVGYFDSVGIPRKEAQGATPQVQVFVERDPAAGEGSQVVLNLIPAQWAVGAIEVNGQRMPAAMVDGTWNDNVDSRRGLELYEVNQMAPGDDAAALRGSYLIVGKLGQETLEPGDPNGWLGQSGSARALNTQYLVLDLGVYEIQGEKAEGGLNLQLAPASVPTSTIDLSQVPHAGRFAMFGTNACVVVDNPGSQIQVPGDTYYIPAFGAYTVDVPAGGANVTLTPPSDVEAASPQGYNPQADREQKLFTADPPVGVQWAQPQTDPFAFASRQGWRTIQLQVVASDTKQPIRGAKVIVYASYTGNWMQSKQGERTLTTDASGRCAIQVPGKDLNCVAMHVQAAGFVPSYKQWGIYAGNTIPEQYTWPAEPGTTVGGMVRDEQDRPIRNVRVYVVAESQSVGPDAPEAAPYRNDIRTDRRGKWKCDAVPAKPGPVRIQLHHPDYISDAQPVRTVPIEKLRNMTAVLVMKQGITVNGKVLGPKGTPIAGATVCWGEYWDGDGLPKTDRQGRFRIPNLPAGELGITVCAPGCAPDRKKITVGPDTRTVEFRLQAAKPLTGRVVDEAGLPISLAQVSVQNWQGGYSLQWQTKTDAQGRFSWAEPPADEVTLDIAAEGYMGDDRALVAGADEQVIVLKKNMTIKGRVVDAATGQPIRAFQAILGYVGGDGTARWLRFNTAKGTDGAYSLTPQISLNQYNVRIEAEGYLPAVSEAFSRIDPSQSLDFALTPGQDVAGVVLGPNGQPLPEAEVALASVSQRLYLADGRLERSRNVISAASGPDGRFRLPPQVDDYTLVAVHEQGFASVTRKEFEKSGRVRLDPWGRIEAMARRGSQPLGSQSFSIGGSGFDRSQEWPVGFNYSPITDEAGRFTIDRVAPGVTSISWQLGRGDQPGVSCQQGIEIKAGQTCRLELGGTGRTVTGRVQVTVRAGRKIRWEYSSCSLQRLRTGPKVPASMPAGSQALDAWYVGWLKSEKGREYRLAERSYGLRPREGGSFEVPDVPAGWYMFSAAVWERKEGPRDDNAPTGIAIQEFEVPGTPDGRSDTPLDLGTIVLKRSADIKAGDPAPAFSAKTLDGASISLSQYRGKYVLLHFWASWGDNSYQLAGLKNIRKQYGQDDRLVIIGLSLDKQAEDAKDFALLNEMTWVQAHVGEWAKTTVPGEYGVALLPCMVLVSPEGKIAVAGDSGREVRNELTKALGKPNASQSSTTQSAGR